MNAIKVITFLFAMPLQMWCSINHCTCYSYPCAVVINGEKQVVELQLNAAYSMEYAKPPTSATNPVVYHQYEDIEVS